MANEKCTFVSGMACQLGRHPSYLRPLEQDTIECPMPDNSSKHITQETLRILHWENPFRSAVIMALTVSSILLTREYSLLLVTSAVFSILIAFNLVYVVVMVEGLKLLTGGDADHRFRHTTKDVCHQRQQKIDRPDSPLIDIADTLIQLGVDIVLIKDNVTSFKWLAFCCIMWLLSAYLSPSVIALVSVVSAFIFPRLYTNNKAVLDTHLHQGEVLFRSHAESTAQWASANLSGAYMALRKSSLDKTG